MILQVSFHDRHWLTVADLAYRLAASRVHTLCLLAQLLKDALNSTLVLEDLTGRPCVFAFCDGTEEDLILSLVGL